MVAFTYDGETYELPKKTLSIVKKEDLMAKKQTSLEEAYRRQYDYALEVLGNDNFSKIFESDNFSEIDLSLLTFICNEIDDAYMSIIYEQQKGLTEKLISNKSIDKFIKIGDSANAVDKLNRK